MKPLSEFGKALKKFCIDNDITTKEIADKLNVTKQVISAVICGSRMPTKNFILKLEGTYFFSISQINILRYAMKYEQIRKDVQKLFDKFSDHQINEIDLKNISFVIIEKM